MNKIYIKLKTNLTLLAFSFLIVNLHTQSVKAQVYCSPTFASTACSIPPYIDFSLSSASFSGITFCTGVPCPTNYGDYYATYTANLIEANAYALTINYNNSSNALSSFSIYAGAWIDWNNDGTFDNVTERIMTSNVGPSGATTQTGASFNALVAGTYRMRVILQTASDPIPCSTDIGQNGEAKDFKIIVDPIQVGLNSKSGTSNFAIFPNPSNLNGFYIKGIANENKQIQLKLIDMLGKIVENKTLIIQKSGEQQFVSFNEATEGIYLLEITDGLAIQKSKIVLKK